MSMHRTALLFTALLAGAASAQAQTLDHATLESRIAAAHGADRWAEVSRVSFDFVVARDGKVGMRRSWDWHPIAGTASLTEGSNGTSTTINLADANTEAARTVKSKWINDTFWLFFPIHAVWGTDDQFTDHGEAPSPIAGKPTRMVTLAYKPEGGGVTPGDAYDLYLDPETFRPVEWSFRKGGSTQANPMTWEDYVQAGPLHISTRHRARNASFELRIENLRVETVE